jgi:hypothetical protein
VGGIVQNKLYAEFSMNEKVLSFKIRLVTTRGAGQAVGQIWQVPDEASGQAELNILPTSAVIC